MRDCVENMNFFVCTFFLLFWGCEVSAQILSEYMQIETGVEYHPTYNISTIGQVDNIPSLVDCGAKCMQNNQCLAATYYPMPGTCKLFKERGSPTVPIINGSATVITLIDRPTRKSTPPIVTVRNIVSLKSFASLKVTYLAQNWRKIRLNNSLTLPLLT